MEEEQGLIAAVTAPDDAVLAPADVVEPLNLKTKKRATFTSTPRSQRPRTNDERWLAAVAQLNDQVASDTKKPAPKVCGFGLRSSRHSIFASLRPAPDCAFTWAH